MKIPTFLRLAVCALVLGLLPASAQLTIAPENVRASARAQLGRGLAAVAITPGQVVAVDPATQRIKLADNADLTARPVGIALNEALAGQPIDYAKDDLLFTPGATLDRLTVYALGTAGELRPTADAFGSGKYCAIIGLPISTTTMVLRIASTNVIVP